MLSFLCLGYVFLPSQLESKETFYNSSQKLWKHRVLTSAEANKNFKEFKGVELDVFFDMENNVFDVKHDGPNSGLTLESYFQNIENVNSYYFWIDFKKLDDSNVSEAVDRLNLLQDKFKLKDRVIVESPRMRLLSKFSDVGFATSYWLPNPGGIKNIKSIVNILRFSPSAISCSYENVAYYTEKYPLYNLHCWTNGMTSEEDRNEIQRISQFENVKIILTDVDYNFLKESN